MRKLINGLRWYRYHKWINEHLIKLIIVWWVLLLILSWATVGRAHDLHLSDVDFGKYPIVYQVRIEGMGYVFGQDTDGNGSSDIFYLLYKDGDFTHGCIHVEIFDHEPQEVIE